VEKEENEEKEETVEETEEIAETVETVDLVDDEEEEEEEVDVGEEEGLELEVTQTTPTLLLAQPTLPTLTTKTPSDHHLLEEFLRPMLVDPLKGIEDHSDEVEGVETEEVEILEARALLKPLILLKLKEKEDKAPTLVDPPARDAPEAVSTVNVILPTALRLPRPCSLPTSRSHWRTKVSEICSRILRSPRPTL